MTASNYSLGIDLGTTSVKICLFDKVENKSVFNCKEFHNAYISNLPQGQKEQHVDNIFKAVILCLNKLEDEKLLDLPASEICISGQMHGVMLWNRKPSHIMSTTPQNKEHIVKYNSEVIQEVDLLLSQYDYSNLITWEDQRCNAAFLADLPKSQFMSKQISSGYGCASLFWLQRSKSPDEKCISKWKCSGTIMDFFNVVLCNRQDAVSCMSSQNAHSWGYFDSNKEEWEMELLKLSQFPTHLLPKIKTLTSDKEYVNIGNLPGISKGTLIVGSFGDLQCTVYSLVQDTSHGAAINIGTSSQFAIPIENTLNLTSERAEVVPYFGTKMLLTASSLNGGNIMEFYCKMILQWLTDLKVQHSYTVKTMLDKLLSFPSSIDPSSSVSIQPTVFGERYDTTMVGSINGIGPNGVSLTELKNQIHVGIIKNLIVMMPDNILSKLKCVSISNDCQIVENTLKKAFDDLKINNINFCRIKETGAEFGAAKLCGLLNKS